MPATTDEKTISDLIRYARTQYNAPSWARLRKKQAKLLEVRHNEHLIPIPEALKKSGRAEPIYTGICAEKTDHAKTLMTDPEGVQWDCAQVGITHKSEVDREFMELFVSSAWGCITEASDRDIEDSVREDNLVIGPSWIRIQPNPSVMFGVLATDSEVALEDVERWAEGCQDIDPTDEVTIYQQMRRESARRQAYFRHVFPVSGVHVSGSSVIPRWDSAGLAEVLEFREISARRVLDDYRDEHDKPKAAHLASSLDQRDIDDDTTVTLLIRATRHVFQVAVTTMLMEVSRDADQRRYATSGAVTDELLYSGPHELGMVPYAYFPGRETASSEPSRRWRPLIDQPVVGLNIALDRLVTQRATVVRHAAWSGIALYRHIDGTPPESGAKAPKIDLPEGGIGLMLGPGETLARPPWIDPEATQLIGQTESQYRSDIDRATFGTAAYGTHGASSGYELAQLQAAAESILMPFIRSFMVGMGRVAELIVRCCRWLIQHGLASVPVRVVTDKGMRYLELKEDLAMIDWSFRASMIPQPLGGEYAKFTTVKAMTDYGFISFAEGQRRMGIRNGDQQQQTWLKEQLVRSPEVLGEIKKAVAGKTVAALNQADVNALPPNQMYISPALAQMAGQAGPQLPPDIMARLPGPGSDLPGGGPGLPNMAAQGPGPSPMSQGSPTAQMNITPFPNMPGMPGGPGGQPPGQAQPMPGGMHNMDYTNSMPMNRAA